MNNSNELYLREDWARQYGLESTVHGDPVTGTEPMAIVNPATGAPFHEVGGLDANQVDAAVRSSQGAFASWRRLDWPTRRAYLQQFAQAILENEAELSTLLTLEQGRPYAQNLAEVRRNVDVIDKVTSLRIEDTLIRDDAAMKAILRYRPLGVVAAIAPWNVPLTMAVGKMTHALYTGNTIVLKPSPYTPLTTLRLGQLGRSIFPPGVFNVIVGGNDAGRQLAEHPLVAKVTFTGSGATGRKVLQSTAIDFKRSTLELGGNDAAIVLPDVDIQEVAQRIFAYAFANAGQICMAVKRLYLHSTIYDDFVALLTDHADGLRVGDGFLPGVQMGPVQNAAQLAIVQHFAERAKADGAVFSSGGARLDRPGYFYAPTVALGLTEGTQLVDEEPFGPILPVLRFETDDEVVARANASPFGLSASVWSSDVDRASAIAETMEAGTVWINDHLAPDPTVPFGGAKTSGLGREYGLLGLQNFMEPTALVLAKKARSTWFSQE